MTTLDVEESENKQLTNMTPSVKQPAQQVRAPGILNEKVLPIPLENGKAVMIPFPMSEEDFDLVLATLSLWKRRIVKNPVVTTPDAGNSW